MLRRAYCSVMFQGLLSSSTVLIVCVQVIHKCHKKRREVVLAGMMWRYCFIGCPHKRDSHSVIGMRCRVHGCRTGLVAAAVAVISSQRMGVAGKQSNDTAGSAGEPSQQLSFSNADMSSCSVSYTMSIGHQARHASQISTTSARAQGTDHARS